MALTLFDQNKLTSDIESLHINDIMFVEKECVNDSWQKSIIQIKEQLLTHALTSACKLPQNNKYIKTIIEIVNKFPEVITFKKVRPVIPEFDEIMTEETDSKEILKFIRKVNYDFMGFSCNHKQFDKQFNKMDSLIAKIYESAEYKAFDDVITSYAQTVYTIQKCDSYGKTYADRTVIESYKYEAPKVIDIILKINARVIDANANVSHKCYKCCAAVRKYNYCVQEIIRMRDRHQREQELLSTKVAEDDFNFDAFMTKHYETTERIPLSHIKDAYKSCFGINAKLDELKSLLENTGRYKVTRCKNIYYANRL